MGINQSYAVFGLGRYGIAVAKELVRHGAEVLAVDSDEELVNAAIAEIPYCKCADITEPEVIKQLGIANIDVVIIAMASSLEASVMATMLCKEIGVKTVIAKCESGIRLAKNLLSSGFVDIMDLSNDVSMVELAVKPEWEGKNLIELNLRKKYSINVVAVIEDKNVRINIDPEKPLLRSMRLIVIADRSKLARLT